MPAPSDKPDILYYPPAVFAAVTLAGIALEWLLPLGILPPPFATLPLIPGLIFLCAGAALGLSGILAFRRAETNVNPHQPALHLALDGPYRFTRNPMYLGMVALQMGLALTFSLDWCLPLAPVLWALLHYGVVLREEVYLTRKFGDPYEDFLSRTRRWI